MAAKRRERPVAAVERILYTREEAATALGMSVDTFERRVQPFIRVVPSGAARYVEMPPEERARRLTALWKRLMDPDGFDRDALATIEGPTHGDQ